MKSIDTERFLRYEEFGNGEKSGETGLLVDEIFEERVREEKIADLVSIGDHYEFYLAAKPYSSGSNFIHTTSKARVLAEFYHKFSPAGSQPLVNREGLPIREPGNIGVIFKKMFSDAEKIVK